jgi:RHS repeat-associated protein
MQSLNLPRSTGYSSLSLKTYLRRALLPALLIFLSASTNTAAGQTPNILFNKASVDAGDRGSLVVNPSTLALELEIPLQNYPGRAGLNVPVTLSYSSKAWQVEYIAFIPGHFSSSGNPLNDGYTRVEARFAEHSAGGWTSSIGFPVLDNTLLSEYYDGAGNSKSTGGCVGSNNPTGLDAFCYIVGRILVRMPDGSTHELRSSDQPFDPVTQASAPDFYAVDGSRMRYNRTDNILYMSDGSRYLLATGDYVDRNGNRLHYTGSGWTDTLGRTINAPPLANAPGTYTYSLPGMSGQYVFVWKRLGDPGVLTTEQPLKHFADTGCPIGNGSFSPHLFVSDIFGSRTCIQNADAVFNPVVLYQIQLPTGRSYTFTYNEYGEIDKVVLPTGGYERYEHALASQLNSQRAPYTQANRGVINRYVSTGAAGAVEDHWSYTPSSGKVSVVAPDNTLTERYMFMNISGICGWGYCPNTARAGKVYEERAYSAPENGVRRLLRRTLTDWAMTGSNATGTPGAPGATRNARVTKEVSILLDADGDAQARTTEYGYDLSNQFTTGPNQTSVSEYNYFPVDQSTAQTAAIGSIPRATLPLRTTETAYLDDDPAYRAQNILGLSTLVTVKDGPGMVVSKAAKFYDETGYQLGNTYGAVTGWVAPAGPRANLTTVRHYLDVNASVPAGQNCPAGVCFDTHDQYDQCGNVRVSWDANNNQSQADYTDSFSDELSRNTYAYLTTTTSAVPDGTGTHGSNTGLSSEAKYDFATGLVRYITDANGQTTTFDYSDPLNRLKTVTRPVGSGSTTYDYGDSVNDFYVRTRVALDDSRSTEAYQYFDELGRPSRSYVYDGSAADRTWVATKSTYDNMGRVATASSPQFRTDLNDFTPSAVTTTEYDDLGRVVKVTTPDNAYVSTSYDVYLTPSLNGGRVTVTDQAGKARSSVSDSLGRLVMLTEAPDASGYGYETYYEYNTLGGLTKVIQGKAGQTQQTRTFSYDSLSRLKSSTNPESGTVTYEYNPDGSLKKRVDARHVQTDYTYDALGRITKRSYSIEPGQTTPANYVAAPEANYFYDGTGMPYDTGVQPPTVLPTPANSAGKLTAVKSSASVTVYTEFDAAGRVKKHRQISDPDTTAERAYKMEYAYDLAGNLVSKKYPSGKIVETEYDGAGRVAGAKNSATGAYYAGGATADTANRIRYAAIGAAEAVRLGNGLWEHISFNSRLQPMQMGLGTSATDSSTLRLTYGYGPVGQNNGDVTSQRIEGGGLDVTQTYDFDPVNRLLSAREAPTAGGSDLWRQAYTYLDSTAQNAQFGNRRIDTSNDPVPGQPRTTANATPQHNPQIDPANNRIAAGQGYTYDAAGNLSQDPSHSYAYDGDNRMGAVDGGWDGVRGASYQYDGDGRRVKKVSASEETVFAYDAAGMLVAEYSNRVEANGTLYMTQDYLGSTRVVTNAGGAVKSRHDYLPFGEEISADADWRTTGRGYVGATVRKKFSGKERDDETGLDYFIARFYSSEQGRFISVDPTRIKLKNIIDPQDLNRYSYVANNPLKFIDPDGMEKITIIITTVITQKTVKAPETRTLHPYPYRIFGGGPKTKHVIKIETDPTKNNGSPVYKNESYTSVFATVEYNDRGKEIDRGLASGNTLKFDVSRQGDSVVIHASGNESNPLVPEAPGITFDFTLVVTSAGPDTTALINGVGDHDGFPAYEILVVRPETGSDEPVRVYWRDPRDTGDTPFSLLPGHTVHAELERRLPPPPPPPPKKRKRNY